MLGAVALPVGPLEASTVVHLPLDRMAVVADQIFHGEVVGVRSQLNARRTSIHTFVTIAVEAYLKGGRGSSLLTLRVLGGEADGYRLVVAGAPRFRVGERVLVFTDGGAGRIPSVLGLGSGSSRSSANRRRERRYSGGRSPGSCSGTRAAVRFRPGRSGPASGRRWARSSGSCGTRSPAHEDAGQGPGGRGAAVRRRTGGGARDPARRTPRRRPDTSSSREPGLPWPSDRPARYWVTDRAGGGLSVDQIVAETRAAFDTWEAPPEIGLSFSYQGRTGQLPFHFFDVTNTVGLATPEHRSALGISETTLAVTSWLTDYRTGALIESDILVNPAFHWTDTPEQGGWDYRSVIVHESGHFLGLGHSNVGREGGDGILPGTAVMWPFSFGPGTSGGRTLTDDDIAGASVLYPGPAAHGGRIRGAVVRANGEPVSFAHVVAYEPSRDHLVGAWGDADGRYEIGGLPGGRYVLRVNPLPDEHAPRHYFFEEQQVDADFRTTVLPRLVVVPAGGVTEVNIEVKP